MDRKKLLLILAAVAIPLALIGLVLLAGLTWYLRGREKGPTPEPAQVTLCDVNASSICVVSFGADPLDQMVINLHLPKDDYPAMYAMVVSRSVSTRYPCRVVEDTPSSVFCSGPKTPLGELIDVRLIRVDSDETIAQGILMVMALALPSPMNFTVVPDDSSEAPLETATLFTRPLPGSTQTAVTISATRTPPGTTRPGPIPTMTGNTPLGTGTHTLTPTGTITPPTGTSTSTATHTPTP